MIVGIDLGTTNSLVSAFIDGKPQLLPNALGSFLTPSAISVDTDGTVLVGTAARERLTSHPDRSAAVFKRAMGTQKRFYLARQEFLAEDLSALVLGALKRDAEAALGTTIDEAIITVPAYFNDAQRKATKFAGTLAGFKVERLLNEPTAAALAYGLHDRTREGKILVLDLGGGTFDVSILEMFDGVMEVRASAGDNFLGGEDFVHLIVDGFMRAVGLKAGIAPFTPQSHDLTHALIIRAAELAKRRLTEAEEAELRVSYDGQDLRWTLHRAEFEALSEPLLKRLRAPIERAIRDTRLPLGEIDTVVLAGGATRMPLFRRFAARLFQRLPMAQIDPDQVVALGAAVQAGLKMRDAALDDIVMTDVTPFTLGTAVAEARDGQIVLNGLYLPIIERNTVVPVSRVRRVATLRDGQTAIDIPIYQGEARMVADNIKLGELKVAIPPAPAGQQQVDIRYTYDNSGLLEVDVAVLGTNIARRLVIEGEPGSLSAAEIRRKLDALAALKVHPRDQEENRALFARAERLYEERLGEERRIVGDWLDRFRLVIEGQEPHAILAFRTEFTAWLNSVDVGFSV